MTTADARQYIGAFGKIHANGTLYPRWLHGRITEVDRTSVDFHPKALRRIGWKMPKKFITK